MINIFRHTGNAVTRELIDGLLAVRALAFIGRRYTCPCCGWRLRAFTHGGTSLKARSNGYCPRCNAKARHRRDWLLLEEQTNLFTDDLRLLHVSPKYSLSRRFRKMTNLKYVAGDIKARANITVRFDVAALPFANEAFDAAICIHVLEHVVRDREGMSEIHRVLRPGGWALISVPVRLDQPTYEDWSVTSPEDRLREFGETDHVRYYGRDLVDRLEAAGFSVRVDLASELSEETRATYGLLTDENVFVCRKPAALSPGTSTGR
jgi:SAM-dependent methyltransferase